MVGVSAALVTRGDVDMEPIVASVLPFVDEVAIWDNSDHDLAVFGRYMAALGAVNDLIYVQDDDVIVHDIPAIIAAHEPGKVVCNMPPEFRHEFYEKHALVGFGACFDRHLPFSAFARAPWHDLQVFFRTCDILFTALTPRVLVDVPKTDLSYSSAPNRMWMQPTHVAERKQVLASILNGKR